MRERNLGRGLVAHPAGAAAPVGIAVCRDRGDGGQIVVVRARFNDGDIVPATDDP